MSVDIGDGAHAGDAIAEQVRLLALSADVGHALTHSEILRDALQRCCDAMVHHLRAALVSIWTLNEADNVLELQASAGLHTQLDGAHSHIAVGEQEIGRIAKNRRPHVTNTVVGDPDIGDHEWAKREGMASFAGYPLLINDRLVGVIALFARRPFSKATLNGIASAVDSIALGVERKWNEARLQQQREWWRVTLTSIGDAVITTDTHGRVTFLNPVAEGLTGWTVADAQGLPLDVVFPIRHEETYEPVENPVAKVLNEGRVVGLGNHTVLIAKDGRITPIDDSAAPIRDADGTLVGVILVFRDVTEQRRAEEEVRQSEARKRAILDAALDCVITCDEHGIVLEYNPAAERTFGFSSGEMIGRDMADYIIAPSLRERHRHGLARYLATGEARVLNRRVEMMAQRATGEEFPVELSVTRIPGDGAPRFTAFVREITDQKRLERRRATRLAITQLIAGASSLDDFTTRLLQTVCEGVEWDVGMIWMVSAHEDVLQCQSVWHRSALSPDDFVAMSRRMRFSGGMGLPGRVWSSGTTAWISDVTKDSNFPRASTATLAGLHSAFAAPIVLGHEVLGVMEFFSREIREPDADLLEMMATIGGQVGQFVERARAQQALHRNAETTRFLADSSASLAELTDYRSTLQLIASLAVPRFADWCAVDILEPDGEVRRLAVTHVDPQKVELAHEIYRRYPPGPDDPRGPRKVLRTGESDWMREIPDSFIVQVARDEEHLRIIRALGIRSLMCVPLRSRRATLGVLTFVTAESGRLYEQGDLRVAEDLAYRAAIAIENASLLATLQEADRRKDEFLAMLAHELRNPLAPIRNAVQLLRFKGPPLPDLQWARDVIDRQAQHMTRLVDDLLDVARITRGNIALRTERVTLASVVNSAMESSRPLVEKWGHELTVTLPPEPIFLNADTARLAQVLSNLLNNAAKYTDQGGRIQLTAEQEGDYAVIRVKDTGIGIPPEMLPKIFDMFTQVERSKERSQGGLGVGLTLVQRLVAMHDGTVEARSDGVGKGSEFVVRLPLAVPTPLAEVAATMVSEPARQRPSCRILVVDDNKDAADSLSMLLRLMGNDVHTANDGLEAVGAASILRPDVVLLDIGLPKLDGYDAARRIRAERGEDVVLIAVTGWGQDEDRRRSREAGFDYHLTKPVELDAMQQVLTSIAPQRMPPRGH